MHAFGRGGGGGGRGGGGARFGGGGARFGGRGGGGGGWGGGGGHHHGGHRGRFRGGFGPGAWRGYWGGPWDYSYPLVVEEAPTYLVTSRIGGRQWTDDIGYTWSDALRVAAARAATSPPQASTDFIRITVDGNPVCAFTAGARRKWTSSCGDVGLGADAAQQPLSPYVKALVVGIGAVAGAVLSPQKPFEGALVGSMTGGLVSYFMDH